METGDVRNRGKADAATYAGVQLWQQSAGVLAWSRQRVPIDGIKSVDLPIIVDLLQQNLPEGVEMTLQEVMLPFIPHFLLTFSMTLSWKNRVMLQTWKWKHSKASWKNYQNSCWLYKVTLYPFMK
ncbi:unnamed protein product [Schistocephalus solidus]|uniref:Uncharacterized protein n=1 Tax=Schistocephalus solidus TaxID=70667 RepID=A0A183TJ76_SCHSO|nr:unnamed protein product [Schistocephalus solidus]